MATMNCLVRLFLLCILVYQCMANGSADPCANPQNLNQVIDFRQSEDLSQNLAFSGAFNRTDTSGCLTFEINYMSFGQVNKPRTTGNKFIVNLVGRLYSTCPGADPTPLFAALDSEQYNISSVVVGAEDQTAILSPFSAIGNLLTTTDFTTVNQFTFSSKNSYVFLPSSEPDFQRQYDTVGGLYFVEPTCVARSRGTSIGRIVYSPLFEFSIEISGGSTYHFNLPAHTPFQADYTQEKFFWEHCTCNIN